ncbi:MFS transporter [Ensifer sp. 22564]|uniref:MFS transporter n=1 Tax=Ensifer sp. 22564 TaxID=3453943 RepID=UPI003F82ACA7
MVLAAYVGGSALGLLLFGHLPDHFDRKTLMVAALAAFAATSLAGAFAPDIAVLIGLRFLQGIAASAAPVFAPGVIRQLFSEKTAVRAIGFLGSVESLVPALVPIAGVALLAHFGWQSSFELLGAAGAIVFVLMLAIGLPREQRRSGTQGTYLQLLTDPVFMRYALSQAMTLGGVLTLVFGIPMVIVETMGGTLNDFIIVQIVSVAGFIVAANLTAKIAARFGTEEVIMAGRRWPPQARSLSSPMASRAEPIRCSCPFSSCPWALASACVAPSASTAASSLPAAMMLAARR